MISRCRNPCILCQHLVCNFQWLNLIALLAYSNWLANFMSNLKRHRTIENITQWARDVVDVKTTSCVHWVNLLLSHNCKNEVLCEHFINIQHLSIYDKFYLKNGHDVRHAVSLPLIRYKYCYISIERFQNLRRTFNGCLSSFLVNLEVH